MVNLKLAQMADAAIAADEEERRQFHQEWKAAKKVREEEEIKKKLDHRRVELTEQEMEKWAFECRKTQKKRRNVEGRKKVAEEEEQQQQQQQEEQKGVEPNEFDGMIGEVDAEAAMPEQPSSPTATINTAELDACEVPVPKPASSPAETDPQPAKEQPTVIAATSEKNNIPFSLPIDPTTALSSNPLSPTERAFARDLSNAHHARLMVAKASREEQENALVAFDAATGYGKVSKKTKLTFSGAVSKGFKGIFGEERCW